MKYERSSIPDHDEAAGPAERLRSELTHFDAAGRARMVDVSAKAPTVREAIATATVAMLQPTWQMIREGRHVKGDVLAVAQVAGIMAAKRTADLIPMCHPIPVEAIELAFMPSCDPPAIHLTATVRTTSRTGVEMEALTAVTVAALTIYDMCKAVDREMTISRVCLLRKTGGKSGHWERAGSVDEA
ncbi:MAG: cyclic pyranopterin monophosphate synthase MoaC [Cyanobacteria bacterium NC_groundwater_1444_Ag_S-0.65um_54_12]|nr:cyclic pyranopterin monophosphate synthase MoaC [Cyanobacteria bacterium NC_groundwater_1444_Ag_S-0.65um_54_12]